jgi:hypothetical protein
MISANVTGGYGPYDFDWKIKGNPNGWSILGGQGTDMITMAAGDKKINLEVTVTGICGKKTKCKVKLDCEDPPAFGGHDRKVVAQSRPIGHHDMTEIYPNPATDILNISVVDAGILDYQIVDQFGRVQSITEISRSSKSTIKINLDGLSPGLYWLIIWDSKSKSRVRKFVKSR